MSFDDLDRSATFRTVAATTKPQQRRQQAAASAAAATAAAAAAAAAHRAEPLYATLIGRGSSSRRRRVFGASREELTDAEGKRLISLHVADAKYDSDSDFDYRQRPPR